MKLGLDINLGFVKNPTSGLDADAKLYLEAIAAAEGTLDYSSIGGSSDISMSVNTFVKQLKSIPTIGGGSFFDTAYFIAPLIGGNKESHQLLLKSAFEGDKLWPRKYAGTNDLVHNLYGAYRPESAQLSCSIGPEAPVDNFQTGTWRTPQSYLGSSNGSSQCILGLYTRGGGTDADGFGCQEATKNVEYQHMIVMATNDYARAMLGSVAYNNGSANFKTGASYDKGFWAANRRTTSDLSLWNDGTKLAENLNTFGSLPPSSNRIEFFGVPSVSSSALNVECMFLMGKPLSDYNMALLYSAVQDLQAALGRSI